jgi:hypothetical protein
MRTSLAALTGAALTLIAASAHAQTGGSGGTGGGTAGLGSCTGSLAGTVGLSIPTPSGRQTVQAASVPFMFNLPECACSPTNPSQQVALEIKLTTALPIATAGTTELWVGNGCDNYTTRTTPNQTACQKLTTLDITRFTTGSTESGLIEIPIPGDALTSPQPNGGMHVCTAAPTTSNNVYIFAYTNPAMPFASCTLNLTQQTQGPTAVLGLNAGSGDSAINLTWRLPPQSSYTAKQFQVLCSDDAGNPIGLSSVPDPLYSTCVNGVLERRSGLTGGAPPTTGGTSDAGVGKSQAFHPLAASLPNVPAITYDMASTDMASTDMANIGSTDMANPVTFGPLASLDKKYACSPTVGATATSFRITGLQNNKGYHFVVLAIDSFGNATPSPAVAGIPMAVEDFYRRYRDQGGAAGSCFIATAAFGSYESGWVHVLRDFRDEVLLPTAIGHDFVDWYYAHSPPAAAWIARHPWPRALVRGLLIPVIAIAGAWVYSTPWQKALVILLLMAWLLRRRLAAAWHGADA